MILVYGRVYLCDTGVWGGCIYVILVYGRVYLCDTGVWEGVFM